MSVIVLLSCLPILVTNLQDERSRVRFLKYIDACVFGGVVVWLIVERKDIQKYESKHVIKLSAPDKFMTDELL